MKDQSRGAIAKVTHWIWKSWNPIIGLGDQYQLSTIHRVIFYNSHRVKSSLLSLELSFRSLLQGRQTSK